MRYNSAPCGTRTHDRRIRNPLLYPAELRAPLKSQLGGYYVLGRRRGKEICKEITDEDQRLEGRVGEGTNNGGKTLEKALRYC
jgi:hypothetical protein